MNPSSPEALLSRLLAAPAGLPPPPDEAAAWQEARRQLELRGHRIATLADGAWILPCGAVHFDPDRFAQYRHGSFGQLLEVWEILDSTNDRAWEGVHSGMPPGAVVLSETQRAGRGRQGRRWLCPPHRGLLFSVVVPVALVPGTRASFLPLALALGVCEALRQCTGRDVRVKWPNDLILQERKLGGLLVESRPAAASCVVLGCGINVHVPPEDIASHSGLRAVSLHEDGEPVPRRETLLAHVLARLEEVVEDWRAERDAALRRRWTFLDVVTGRDVEAQLPQGTLRGRAEGITESGLLCLRLSSGEVRTLAAGEVHLI